MVCYKYTVTTQASSRTRPVNLSHTHLKLQKVDKLSLRAEYVVLARISIGLVAVQNRKYLPQHNILENSQT